MFFANKKKIIMYMYMYIYKNQAKVRAIVFRRPGGSSKRAILVHRMVFTG